MILRDRDANSGWASAADGTLEERIYYAQNWRADVSVVLSSGGLVKEWVKYSAYGVPYSITPGDFDADGFLTSNDSDEFDAAYNGGAGAWDARVDLNLDGSLTSADETIFTDEFNNGEAAGPGVLSRSMVASRVGYAGYQHARELTGAKWHVRHRVLDSETGRWTRRDPLGYLIANLYDYGSSHPVARVDPLGLMPCFACDNKQPPADDTPWLPPRLPIVDPLPPPQFDACWGVALASEPSGLALNRDCYRAYRTRIVGCCAGSVYQNWSQVMSCIGQAATDAQECMDNGGGGGGGGLPGGPGAPGDGTNGITREDLLWGMLCMASGQECCRDEYDLDDFLGCAALVDCLFDSPSVIYSALGTCCSQPTEAEKLGCLLGMIAVR